MSSRYRSHDTTEEIADALTAFWEQGDDALTRVLPELDRAQPPIKPKRAEVATRTVLGLPPPPAQALSGSPPPRHRAPSSPALPPLPPLPPAPAASSPPPRYRAPSSPALPPPPPQSPPPAPVRGSPPRQPRPPTPVQSWPPKPAQSAPPPPPPPLPPPPPVPVRSSPPPVVAKSSPLPPVAAQSSRAPLAATRIAPPSVLTQNSPPPIVAQTSRPLLAATRIAPPPSIPAPAAPTSPPAPSNTVRRAIYALLGLLVLGAGAKLALPQQFSPAKASTAGVTDGAARATAQRTPKPRPVIEARTVASPSVKEAAAAFARGDYREALAQYRALAQRQPNQPAFQSLIRVLERRLASQPRP